MADLHPHQRDLLHAELRRDEYRKLDADAAFVLVNEEATRHRMGSARFDSEELRRQFPTGVPGFPNVVYRRHFDAAWSEVNADG